MLQGRQYLYVCVTSEREMLLTFHSDPKWNGRVPILSPVAGYGVPPALNGLVAPQWLPWHAQHHECQERGAQNPFSVASFVLVVNTGNKTVLMPMEKTTISGCALCALLSGIARYLNNRSVIIRLDSMEFAGDIYGRKVCAVVAPNHGTAANQVLVDLLQSVGAGTILSLKLRICRQQRVGSS
jgi:hypothetical protein